MASALVKPTPFSDSVISSALAELTLTGCAAQAQMENVMRSEFDATNIPPEYGLISYPDTSYSIVVEAVNLNMADGSESVIATGNQKITVRVYHGGDLVTKIQAIKGKHD